MRVYVNGRETKVAGQMTLSALLDEKGLDPKTIVVEHNLVIIPKDEWPNLMLADEDKLEIVSFVGGG